MCFSVLSSSACVKSYKKLSAFTPAFLSLAADGPAASKLAFFICLCVPVFSFLMSVCQVIKSPASLKPYQYLFLWSCQNPHSQRGVTRVLNVNQTSLTCEGGKKRHQKKKGTTPVARTPHPLTRPGPLLVGCNLTRTYVTMEI